MQQQLIPDHYYDELALQSLYKNKNDRSEIEIFYMVKLFKQFDYFKGLPDDVIKQCCSKLKYEAINRNQLIYKRLETIKDDQKKLYLILSGELVVLLSKELLTQDNHNQIQYNEICRIKQYQHFGNYNFLLNNEDIFEQFGLIVKPLKQVKVATLNLQYYQNFCLQYEEKRVNYEISKLYDFQIFNTLQYKHLRVKYNILLRKFFLNCFKFTFTYMEQVFPYHDTLQAVYFIIKGQFQIKRIINGELQGIGILSEGQLIGEHEAINNIDKKQFSLHCVAEKGELLICDYQLFNGYLYDLIKDNIQQVIDVKTKFHQLDRKSIKKELTQLTSLIPRRTSFCEIQKENKTHYKMKPKRKHGLSENHGKQSYYDLFVNIYQTASKQTQLANDERHLRINHYIKYTLKPLQYKMKQSQNSSLINEESIINMKPINTNEILIQAINRTNNNNNSKLRKTFHKTQSMQSISPIRKQQQDINEQELSEFFFVKKQYKSKDKLIYNQ